MKTRQKSGISQRGESGELNDVESRSTACKSSEMNGVQATHSVGRELS